MILERYFGSFLILISSVFLIMSFELSLYESNAGVLGPGFFPRIVAALLVMLVGYYLFQLIRTKFDKSEDRANKSIVVKQIILVFFLAVCIALSNIIGMLPSVGVFVFVMLAIVQRTPWVKSLLLSIILIFFMYAVFELWLGLPLPQGIFE